MTFPTAVPIANLCKFVILIPTCKVKGLLIGLATATINVVWNHVLQSFCAQTHHKRMKESLNL